MGEHFDIVLNRPSSINEEAINRLPQMDINTSLALAPTIDEVNASIASLSNANPLARMGYLPKYLQLVVPPL